MQFSPSAAVSGDPESQVNAEMICPLAAVLKTKMDRIVNKAFMSLGFVLSLTGKPYKKIGVLDYAPVKTINYTFFQMNDISLFTQKVWVTSKTVGYRC